MRFVLERIDARLGTRNNHYGFSIYIDRRLLLFEKTRYVHGHLCVSKNSTINLGVVRAVRENLKIIKVGYNVISVENTT